jgi:hypothetical protein
MLQGHVHVATILAKRIENIGAKGVLLYAARIEDLGPGRFREGRLCPVLPKAPTEFGRTPLLAYRVADAGVPEPAWSQRT